MFGPHFLGPSPQPGGRQCDPKQGSLVARIGPKAKYRLQGYPAQRPSHPSRPTCRFVPKGFQFFRPAPDGTLPSPWDFEKSVYLRCRQSENTCTRNCLMCYQGRARPRITNLIVHRCLILQEWPEMTRSLCTTAASLPGLWQVLNVAIARVCIVLPLTSIFQRTFFF